jgi:hypothetical protein
MTAEARAFRDERVRDDVTVRVLPFADPLIHTPRNWFTVIIDQPDTSTDTPPSRGKRGREVRIEPLIRSLPPPRQFEMLDERSRQFLTVRFLHRAERVVYDAHDVE